VVVLTYNSRAIIADCLRSALAQTYPSYDVMVVDNGSSDGTPELVQEAFPEVRLVRSSVNGGYGAGNNLGAAASSGEILAFLNPDAVAEPTWLAGLIDAMLRTGRQIATSKIVLRADPARLNTAGKHYHFLGLSYCRGWNEPRNSYSREEITPGVSGAAFAITRALFERLGGFDETLFMYHDDVDLSLRALLLREPSLYVPGSVVAHDYELRLSPQKWMWVESNRLVVLLKSYRAATLLVLLPGLLLVEALTLAHLALRGPRFLRAKLASYGWLMRHWTAVMRNRREVQAGRRLGDRELLAALDVAVPYATVQPGRLGAFAAFVLDPLFATSRRLALSMVRW
jgi:GT2 family glycosyltransferase